MNENYDKFIEFIKIGNIEEAKSNFIFEYFNKEDKYGLKPIHWACLTSNIEILEWMLQEKCDIETSSKNGWRPIHFADFIGNKEIVQYLIESKCKTDNRETDCNNEFIDEILNENINLKIGLSMGLKCGRHCQHEFCLKSLLQCESYINRIIKKGKNVIQVNDSYSNRKFAIKINEIYEYDEYENRKCIGPKLNEILPNLDHSKIAKLYGLIQTETKMILFTEWMSNSPLRYIITKKGPFNIDKIYRYCKDILPAIAFLHDNKILHRFIHPAKHIFLDNNGGYKLQLSNYSYSLVDGDVEIDEEWLRKYYTYSYAAPELVNKGILSYPYDIWLFGYTVIEISTGNQIKYHSDKFDEIERFIPKIFNKTLQSFIRSMIMRNPTERATANELLNHEFMRNMS